MQLASENDNLQEKLNRLKHRELPRVVDLFAGCGGLSLGFQRSGFQIVGGVEFDPKAARTHGRNFFKHLSSNNQERHCSPHDIIELTPHRFMSELLLASDPTGLVDVMIAGPPCQAFSRIGRAKLRQIMKHPQAFLGDDRANLYVNMLEYVEYFRPLAVVMENVPEITKYGGLNVAEEIAASLEGMGYICKYTLLNAAHYGVPQLRQRFYMIALLKVLELEPSFPPPTHYRELPIGYTHTQKAVMAAAQPRLFENTGFRYVPTPEPSSDLPSEVSVQEALADLPVITHHLGGQIKRGVRNFETLIPYKTDFPLSEFARSMRQWPGFEAGEGVYDHVIRYLPRDYPIFRRMQPGDQYPEANSIATQLFEEALLQNEKESGERFEAGSQAYEELKAAIVPPYDPGKFYGKWRKLEPDKPARTLTAHIGKDTYSHIHYDSLQARVISVREAARLQSFPDGFEFTGPMNPAFRQIGNAVPPLQAYALAGKVLSILHKAVENH